MTDNIHARLESRNGGQAVFDGVRVDGQVAGMLLDMSSVQTFRNPGTRHIELVYTFPLPADAVLLSLTVRLGERQLTGKIVEKQEASGRYEDTLAEGDTAIMLERANDGSYCLNFGNLGPGETGEISLRYAQALRFEGDALRVCIPTVIAPRYGDPVRDAGLAPHQAPTHDLFVQYPFSLALQFGPEFAAATVASPSHKIATRAASTGISVALPGDAALDRDFVLTLAGLAGSSMAIAAPDPVAPGQAAVLAGFRPRFADTAARPIRIKILVDCSGSMAGDSIAASRKALQAVVAGFGEGDRFSLSRFGDSVEHRNHHLWKKTEVTRLSAARWIGDLAANLGGTEMEAALASTFALDGAAPSDVLLVTDGHINAIDSVIEAARGAGHRLFIVAIGSAASAGHLRRLARATGGTVDFVAPGEGVEPAIRRMFARLRSPRLGDLRLAWTSGRNARWASMPDAAFSGDTVHVYALVEGEATGDELRLYGCDGEGAEHEIGVAAVTATPDDGALARMAIHAKLHEEGAPLGAAQRTQFACDYGLMTAHTNFLLTLERAAGDKAQAMPELQRVAHMLPAGWGGAGSVVGSGIPKQVAVWRRESVSDQVHAMQANGVEDYDIPAFLRKADADLRCSIPSYHRGKSIVQRVAEWWWGAEGGGGSRASGCLAPLALHGMLASTPRTLWDTTYGDMLASGIDRAVVDWLCVTFGTTWPEHVVVVSFMACMAQPQMRDTLVEEAAPSWRTAFKPASWKRKAPAPALPPGADAQLVACMAVALAAVTAQAWPPAVLATPAGAPAGSASEAGHGLAA